MSEFAGFTRNSVVASILPIIWACFDQRGSPGTRTAQQIYDRTKARINDGRIRR